MGCGSSAHQVEVDEAEERNDVDPYKKATKSVGRAGFGKEQDFVNVASTKEGKNSREQEKHVTGKVLSDIQNISTTSAKTEQAKSGEKFVKNDIIEDNKSGVVKGDDIPNGKDDNGSSGQTNQVIDRDGFFVVSACMDQSNESSEVHVTPQTGTRDSGPAKDGYSSRGGVKKTSQNETNDSFTQVVAIPNQSFQENKDSFANEISGLETDSELTNGTITTTHQTAESTDLNQLNAIEVTDSESNQESTERTKETYKDRDNELTHGAAATDQTAENTDLHLSENQLDAVKVTESEKIQESNVKEATEASFEEEMKLRNVEDKLDVAEVTDPKDIQENEESSTQKKDIEKRTTELENGDICREQTAKNADIYPSINQDIAEVKDPLFCGNLNKAVTSKNESDRGEVLQILNHAPVVQATENIQGGQGNCATDKSENDVKINLSDGNVTSAESPSVVGEMSSVETEAQDSALFRDVIAENRLIAALRLSCKLSPGHLVKDLNVMGVKSVQLMRSLSPGVVTVAELIQKLVHLTELDLSGNLIGPQGFRVICLALRRNATLKSLNLANNLTDTDSSDCLGEMLSVNSTLERLDVSGNNLGSDYFSRCVGPALMSNKSLKVLKFTSCGSNDVSAICEAMVEGNTSIEELDASNNHIGAVFGEGLLKILQKPGCRLRHLDVHGTSLGNDGMAALRKGIQNNNSLISVNAAGHQVSCLSFLMEFLWSCICHPSLEELVLDGTKIGERDEWKPSGVIELERSSNLKKLLISGCSLTNQALGTLAENAQGKLYQLFSLDLSSNDQLTTKCLSSICTLTSSDQSVHSLCAVDFSLNVADDIAAEIVNLPQLKNLKSLLLKKCRISPNFIADLSKLVAVTTPEVPLISSLTLDGIKLSGTDVLKRMLGLSDMFIPITPCSFELLSLIGCGLNDRDVKPLMTAIGNGLIIKELRLAANRLTDTSVNNLLESTGNSLSLETLDLSINKIRNGGAEKLACALADKLANLKSLFLGDNCIGREGILALVGKIGSGSQLGVLNLKSQQQALGEEDVDQIMERLAEALGFDPQSSDPPTSDVFVPPSNFSVNLTGLGGEPGELGPKLDSLAVLTDYSSKHRRTLTLDDALQLSVALSQTENTRSQMSQGDWNRVISADKDAPGWLQISSQRACAIYVSNLPLSVTAEKLEGQLDSEAECNVVEVYLLKDQILRKPNGLAWVLFADAESVQRAVEYYNSGQAFMYGTPFVISSVNVDVIADTDMEENALAKARQEMNQRARDRKADQTVHAQLVQSNYSESLARHEYAAQHPAYADGRVW